MSVENASQLPAGVAVSKALADAPCALCKVAQAGRQTTEQAPLAKDELAKVKAKADPAAGEIRLLLADSFTGRNFEFPSAEESLTRVREVPVPSPRQLV